MEHLFSEDDLVWHAKHGLGKVGLADVGSVLVSFDNGGEELFELNPKKEPPVRKLRPEGFTMRLRNEPDVVRALAEKDVPALLIAMHGDFGPQLKAEDIREKLTEASMAPDPWDEWWKKTSAALKSDPRFLIEKNTVNYRGDLVSIADDLHAGFKRAHNLKEKQKICREMLKMEAQGVPVEDAKEAAITFFAGTAASTTNNLGARLEALLFLKCIDQVQYDLLKGDIDSYIRALDRQAAAEALAAITDNVVRKELLALYEELLPEIFIEIAETLTKRFRKTQRDWVLDTLLEYENKTYIRTLLDTTLADVPTNQQPFLWLAKKIMESPAALLELGYKTETVIRHFFKLFSGVHITSAFSSNPKDGGPSVSREEDEIIKFLLKKKDVLSCLKHHPDSTVLLFGALYAENNGILEEDRIEMLKMLREKYPALDFQAPVAAEVEELILTRETFDRYEAELADIIENKLSEVAQALKTAREWGDISENAEFHAAKEKQGMLVARRRQLERLLESAKVLNE